MNTWKQNLEETKKHYINWWNHKGIVLNMWEHFQEGVKPHADIHAPKPYRDLNQRWFDPEWRAEYLDWYVAHSSLMADMLPVANTQLGPGSLAAILGGVFEGGEDTIWIHPDPNYTDDIKFDPQHPNWLLHKELLKACKAKAPPRSVDEDVLDKLKGDYPEIIEMLVKYRKALKLISTYIDNIYDIIDENGRIHARFKSNGAVTGRMSSNGPNLQNIPSHGESEEIRKMYIGQTTYRDVEMRSDEVYVFDIAEEIQLKSGEWTWVEKLKKGDIFEDDSEVLAVQVKGFKVGVKVKTND